MTRKSGKCLNRVIFPFRPPKHHHQPQYQLIKVSSFFHTSEVKQGSHTSSDIRSIITHQERERLRTFIHSAHPLHHRPRSDDLRIHQSRRNRFVEVLATVDWSSVCSSAMSLSCLKYPKESRKRNWRTYGITQFTLIPTGPNSAAAVFVNPLIPHFVAE